MKNFVKEIKFISSYSIVTISTTLGYLLIYVTLVDGFAYIPWLAALIGYMPCLIVGFFLTHHWVFKSRKRYLNTSYRYGIVNGLGYVWNVFAVYTGTVHFELNYVTAQIFAFILVASNNYLLNRNWTFSEIDHFEDKDLTT